MVQREPGEEGGEYFRLYPEGLIRNFDGVHVHIEMQEDGNMNRNFPTNWTPQEYGAGEYPFSEPETASMRDVILNHPNITGMCALSHPRRYHSAPVHVATGQRDERTGPVAL